MISSQISRYICNISLNYHPLSSLLLLRISPNFFDYSASSLMCLSSRNRSICKAFRHIMPYSAPLCQVLHYSKTGVPWQIKSTLIFMFFLLKRYDLPRFAHISGIVFDKRNVRLSSGHSTVCTFYGKSRQNKAKCYTQTDTNRIRILGESIRLKMMDIVKK